ncbi:PAS domain-containing sensor histidine kinase [Flavobacterium psychrotrophum]|uniref:PAS domain-containing sensor histidine kinase n=1 Tax=Flavobacterium psychrotrophum TaxID=2294119 RepID=UPI000E31047D|nr:PAS domain S-box protein [Flavobacterium psychrotrophum]
MQHPGLNNVDLSLVINASGIGVWLFNEATGIVTLDERSQLLFGYPHATGPYNNIFTLTDADDLPHVSAAIQRALITGEISLSYLPHNSNTHIIVKGKRVTVNDEDVIYGTVQKAFNNAFQPGKSQETLANIIAESTVAIGLYVGRELVVGIANDVILSFWGKTRAIIGQKLADAVPELEGQPFLQILDNVFTTGEIYTVTDEPAYLAVDGVLDTYYFDFTYKPLFNRQGEVYAIMNTAVNVTDRVVSKRRLLESEARFRNVTEQSPMAIGFLTGKDMVVEIANEMILKIWGKDESIISLPLSEALPEIKGQGFLELLDGVYNTGIPHRGYDTLVKLTHDNLLTDVYVDFTYSPFRNEHGEISGIVILANDVSDRNRALKEIAASEEKFRSVIYSAQAAVAVFKGEELVADLMNNEFLRFVGRTREEMEGLPLLQSMPEMEGQASIDLMREVFAKGIKTHHFGRQVNIMRNGVLTQNFYNVSYSPLYDGNGKIYAVLDIAIDVTETIKAQEALRETETALRGAIELAELGTWTVDPSTGVVDYSERVLEWFGLTGAIEDLNDVINSIHPDDRQRIADAVDGALALESDGHYDEEFRVISRITGRERILHAQGKAFRDNSGKPYMLRGTAQDITATKKIQLALENEVKERTEALQKANYELEEINLKLINTNQELEQYAYVASHDLQEPLRKISMFSNLLKDRDVDNIHALTIDKIVKASDRMSLLIKDLLEFSRLLSPDVRFVKTNIENIVKNIIHDFELLIEERGAVVHIGHLPEIEAVSLQMNQLFYNLVGNALKFVEAGKIPTINISSGKISRAEVALYIKSPLPVQYYKIEVRDNGIGIEEQYKKQIFEVFKRLHSRSEYSGSGIGLAICRRIVNHHNGAIYVESVQGQGTTFVILLPEAQ